MRVGTKSVLFGAHAFWLHPWFVALAWWRLYGFPWDPRLWVAFFVHDLGYFGLPNMDGEEGGKHSEWGARLMSRLFDTYPRDFVGQEGHSFLVDPALPGETLTTAQPLGRWGRLTLYHSRFYAKNHGFRPSRLCMADKLAIVLTPSWLYVPMASATGEILEYMRDFDQVNPGQPPHFGDRYKWHGNVKDYVRRYVEEHLDGRDDTWTTARRDADGTGVWS